MNYAYIRIDHINQSYEHQRNAIDDYCKQKGIVIDNWITEGLNDEASQDLWTYLKQHDYLIITDLEILHKDWNQVQTIYHNFINNEINLEVVNYDRMNLDFSLKDSSIPYSQYKTDLIDVYTESLHHGRQRISKNTKEALQALKEKGVELGRPKHYDHNGIINMYLSGHTYEEISTKFGVSRAMISKIVKKHGIQRRRQKV